MCLTFARDEFRQCFAVSRRRRILRCFWAWRGLDRTHVARLFRHDFCEDCVDTVHLGTFCIRSKTDRKYMERKGLTAPWLGSIKKTLLKKMSEWWDVEDDNNAVCLLAAKDISINLQQLETDATWIEHTSHGRYAWPDIYHGCVYYYSHF